MIENALPLFEATQASQITDEVDYRQLGHNISTQLPRA